MSEQIAKLNIEEKLIACIELAQKRQADIQALRAENTRLRQRDTTPDEFAKIMAIIDEAMRLN